MKINGRSKLGKFNTTLSMVAAFGMTVMGSAQAAPSGLALDGAVAPANPGAVLAGEFLANPAAQEIEKVISNVMARSVSQPDVLSDQVKAADTFLAGPATKKTARDFLRSVGIRRAEQDALVAHGQSLIQQFGLEGATREEIGDVFVQPIRDYLLLGNPECVDKYVMGESPGDGAGTTMSRPEDNTMYRPDDSDDGFSDIVPGSAYADYTYEQSQCLAPCMSDYLLEVALVAKDFAAGVSACVALGPFAPICIAAEVAHKINEASKAYEKYNMCHFDCTGEFVYRDYCVDDGDCSDDEFCWTGVADIGTNQCRAKKQEGKVCARDGQCLSDTCKYKPSENLVSKVCRP